MIADISDGNVLSLLLEMSNFLRPVSCPISVGNSLIWLLEIYKVSRLVSLYISGNAIELSTEILEFVETYDMNFDQ